jgi:hypothetical protein
MGVGPARTVGTCTLLVRRRRRVAKKLMRGQEDVDAR